MTAARLEEVLYEARSRAFPPGEFVGQESFVTAGEVLALARRAGIDRATRVLDLCCGRGGPGLHIVERLGCAYAGVDSSAEAIQEARRSAAARGLAARFEVATVPPVPLPQLDIGQLEDVQLDVVLLIETLLAFRDKRALLREISAALPIGGRLACTVEAGAPLTDSDRAVMPAEETVWPVTMDELARHLESVGMHVDSLRECTDDHRAAVDGLLSAYRGLAVEIRAAGGHEVLDDVLTSHRLWSEWFREGRIRKFAVVAERVR